MNSLMSYSRNVANYTVKSNDVGEFLNGGAVSVIIISAKTSYRSLTLNRNTHPLWYATIALRPVSMLFTPHPRVSGCLKCLDVASECKSPTLF